MWTAESIQAMLAGTGLPVSCGPFPDVDGVQAPAPPFILWNIEGNDLYADDCNYGAFSVLIVELYTRTRNFAQERALEAVLRENGFAWDKEPDYMGREKLHAVTYSMGAPMGGGGDGG